MFGDYYTNDLISASPKTNMLGNEINLFVQGGSEKNLGASLVLVLMAILAVGMAYYLYPDRARPDGSWHEHDHRLHARRRAAPGRLAPAAPRSAAACPGCLRNPWGEPRFLVAVTWRTSPGRSCPWSIAILFSFNAGKSRSVWQGFSIRWWWGDPDAVDLPRPPVHAGAGAQPAARRAGHG